MSVQCARSGAPWRLMWNTTAMMSVQTMRPKGRTGEAAATRSRSLQHRPTDTRWPSLKWPEEAAAGGFFGRFKYTRLRGCWRVAERPLAPQIVYGLPTGSFLGAGHSLEDEASSHARHGWLRFLNLLTTVLTVSPNKPELEIGASMRIAFSFSLISVIFRHRWHSATTKPAILRFKLPAFYA